MKAYKVQDRYETETVFHARSEMEMKYVIRRCYGREANFAKIVDVSDSPKEVVELIEEFESKTGEAYDAAGPLPAPCSECGALMQYYFNARKWNGHTCHGIEAESKAAARFEQMAHGSGE